MNADRNFFIRHLAQAPETGARGDLRAAAVLIPVVDRAEAMVLFTLRTDHLPTHAGQVSFPGGRVHAGETAAETALRETHEEIGVASDHIDIVGYLSSYNTGTGYSIVPVVGIVHPDHTLAPNVGEVAEVFEVPLAYLLDPQNRALKQRARANGAMMETWEIPFGRHVIWGATARIVVDFTAKLGV